MPLFFHPRDREIWMTWIPGGETISAAELRAQMEDQPFVEWFVHEQALEQFLSEYRADPGQERSVVLAEQRDSRYEVHLSPDKLQALLTVTRAYGGKKPHLEGLGEFLRTQRIIYGVRTDQLEQLLQQGHAYELLIARGDPPIDGEDARFEALVYEPEEAGRPRILEDDRANFHDLQLMTTVETGAPLMRKIPATEGTPGLSVTREGIPQRKGKDKPFGMGRGSQVSADDPLLLVAAEAGQVKVRSSYVSVEPVYRVDQVGAATGNILFPGTVVVDGDVAMGYRIQATGDILVGGTVESADLIASGNILAYNGMVGNRQAHISAIGTIQARFVENSILTSFASVFIADQVIHSRVVAHGDVEVGGSGPVKGRIVGGSVSAGNRIVARVAGAPSAPATVLEILGDPLLQQQLSALREQIQQAKQRLDAIGKAMIQAKLQRHSPALITALEALRETLLMRLYELSEKESLLQQTLQERRPGKIVITEHIYAGVTVRIGPYTRTFHQDFSGATLYIDSSREEIAIGSVR
jgi:uncharacterized protein (DUF342 family)